MDDIHHSLNGFFRSLEASNYADDEDFRPASHIYNRHGPNVDTDEEDMEEALSHMLMGERQISDDSSDDDIQPAKRPRTTQFRGQNNSERVVRRRRNVPDSENSDSDLDDENLPDPPDWFLWQSFQHSKLLVVPFMLGGMLPLLLGGDMLIAVMTLGALISHLFYEGGSSKHASTVCIITTVCAAIVIIYNITPIILWTSVLYVIVLAAAFVYTILTGAWPLLLIKDFCRREPYLSYYLEGLMFTMYPLSSIVLLTWAICMLTSSQYAPYILQVTGFLFLRMFLRPTVSSFVKDDWPDECKKLVVDPVSSLVMASFLAIVPGAAFLVIHLLTRSMHTSALGATFEGFSILLSSIFLVTFLHLSVIIDHFGITKDVPLRIRKVVAIAVIMTSALALYFDGYKSVLLPWWPFVFLCAWAAQGYSLARTEKRHSIFLTSNVAVLSFLVVVQMPLSIVYNIGLGGWSIQLVYLTVLFNAILCAMTVYASKYCTKDVFSCLVLVQSFIFSYLVSIFHQESVMSTGFVFVLQAFCCYFILRLHHVNKLLWQHTILSASLHLTVIFVTLAIRQTSSGHSSLFFFAGSLSFYVLMIAILHIFIKEKSERIYEEKFVRYLSAVCVLCVCHLICCPQLITYVQISEESSSFIIVLGFALLLTSAPALKLVKFHTVHSHTANSLWIVLLVAGASLVAIQPTISVDWFDLVRLLVLQAVVSGCVLVVMINRVKSTVPLYILCTVMGISVGIVGFTLMYDTWTPMRWVYAASYSVQAALALAIAVTAYKQAGQKEHIILVMCLSAELLSVLMVTLDFLVYGTAAAVCSPGLVGAWISVVIVASIIKSQALYQLPQLVGDVSTKTYLPATGNAATVLGFLYMCLLRPYHLVPMDIWFSSASSVFFLLRRDQVYILQGLNHKNHVTPTIVVISLYLIGNVLYHSPVWLPYRYFTTTLAALTEMASVVLTAPVVATLWVVLWHGDFHNFQSWSVRGQALSVIYLIPFFLFFLLLPIATTYYSQIYGILGLCAATWMWRTKIPLTLL